MADLRSTSSTGKMLSRRGFLVGIGLAGASAVLVTACSSGGGGAASTPAAGSAPAQAAPAAAGATPTTATTSSQSQPNATAAPASAGQITLNWFLPLSAAPEIAIWTQFVDRFQKANLNIVIKGSYESWGNYWTKLQTVMAGGAIPDVIWLHYTRVAEWASKDVMRPLDDNLATDKIEPKQFVFDDAMVYKGHMYAIPKDNGVNALWFNKDRFEKASVPLPTFTYKWEDWLTGMKKLTVDKNGKSADQSGFDPMNIAKWGTVQPQATSPRGEGFYIWFYSMGGKLYNDDMTQTLIDQPESVQALQFMADLVVKEHVAPPPGAISQPGDPFLNGLVATTWAHHAEEFYWHEQKTTFKLDEVYYPQGQGGVVISGGTTGFAIPKQSKYPDQAWVLTKFMTGKEQQAIIIKQHRWAAGLRDMVPEQYDPSYNTANYVPCHVDPLTGKGPQAVAAPSPAALAQIEQVWSSVLDPVWLGKAQAKDVVGDLKKQIDQLLQQKTQI